MVSNMTAGDDPTSCEQLAVLLPQVSSEEPTFFLPDNNVSECPQLSLKDAWFSPCMMSPQETAGNVPRCFNNQ